MRAEYVNGGFGSKGPVVPMGTTGPDEVYSRKGPQIRNIHTHTSRTNAFSRVHTPDSRHMNAKQQGSQQLVSALMLSELRQRKKPYNSLPGSENR